MKRIIDIDEEEYNRIKHFCSFGDNNIPLGWYEIAKSKSLQEEFEEIKAELKNKGLPTYTYIKDGKTTQRNVADDVIDKHISNLEEIK